jgi:hypothetical protein
VRPKSARLSYVPTMAVLLGSISVPMGREARSHGYLWTYGYNARIGRETTGTTLSWERSTRGADPTKVDHESDSVLIYLQRSDITGQRFDTHFHFSLIRLVRRSQICAPHGHFRWPVRR